MAFTDQEKQIITYGKAAGKSQAEVQQALVNLRVGIAPAPTALQPNSTIKDLAIGGAKGFAQTIAASGAQNAGPVGQDMLNHAPAFKQSIETASDALHATNRTQQVGKGIEVAAEFLSPFVVSRMASLVSKAPALLTPATEAATGIRSLVKPVLDKVKEFAANPKLALAKKNIEPQLETSANRLFLEGTKRVGDPVARYDTFISQSKKALTDIKADPAVAEVGSHIGDAFKEVVAQRRAVGATMGEELKTVGSIKTDVLPVVDKFVANLSEQGLKYDRVKRAIIPVARQTKMTAEDTALLEKYGAELQKLGSKPTISDLDAFLSRIPDDIKIYKASKNITGTTNGERIIKQSLDNLRGQFTANPALAKYAAARQAYSELSNFIDEGVSYLGKLTQSGDFAKDASLAKSSVQSILNNGKKDWLIKLEQKTGYPAMDDAVLALQAMKDAGDFRGLSLLQTLSEGSLPTSASGVTQKMIDFAVEKASRIVGGTPEEQTRAFLNALKEAAQQPALK
jgi:hypothetical protein